METNTSKSLFKSLYKNMYKSGWVQPIEAFALARSAVFQVEGLMGPLIEFLSTRARPALPSDNPEMFTYAQSALKELLKQDSQRIADGVYPLEVLMPENPLRHLQRFPKIFFDAVAISRRRKSHSARGFSKEANELLSEMPKYYQQNFHYQSDGYLSERSAELYEHQVDILFAGASDAMRRLIVVALREKFGNVSGEGLSFLELGAGTGRATKFVRLAFPKAKIVALDLSGPYLKLAQKNLKPYQRHDFVEGNAENLPFKDHSFDAVFSVFLFHELPRAVRETIVKESVRVLKPQAFFGMVDSLQLGDVAKLDSALLQFPVLFHEPFYKNYLQHPVRDLFSTSGLKDVKEERGFFSKVVYGST
jgi:ubiquinone/menaquinone biosynthesis C-methylase UbiE